MSSQMMTQFPNSPSLVCEFVCLYLCNHKKIMVGYLDNMLVDTIGDAHLLELKGGGLGSYML